MENILQIKNHFSYLVVFAVCFVKLFYIKIFQFQSHEIDFSGFLDKPDPEVVFCQKPYPDQDGAHKKKLAKSAQPFWRR